jgi:hypothetical protein
MSCCKRAEEALRLLILLLILMLLLLLQVSHTTYQHGDLAGFAIVNSGTKGYHCWRHIIFITEISWWELQLYYNTKIIIRFSQATQQAWRQVKCDASHLWSISKPPPWTLDQLTLYSLLYASGTSLPSVLFIPEAHAAH